MSTHGEPPRWGEPPEEPRPDAEQPPREGQPGENQPGDGPPGVWRQPGAGQPGWGQPGWGQPGWTGGPGPGAGRGAGDERTGPLPLHPMTIADILDGSFKLFRANFPAIVILTSLFVIPVNLVSAFLQRNTLGGVSWIDLVTDPEAFSTVDPEATWLSTTNLSVLGFTALFSLATAPFVAGLISKVAGSSYLGTRLEWQPALRGTVRRFFSLLGSYVLVHLVQVAPFVVNFLLFILALAVDAYTLVVVLLALAFPVTLSFALVAMGFYLTVAPAVVLENLGAARAMRRSWRLVRPRFWVVLGIGVLSGLVASFLGEIISTPFSLIAAAVGFGVGWPLLALASILPSLVTVPFLAIVATLVYFDLRIRHEAFDLELAAAALARDRPQSGGPYE